MRCIMQGSIHSVLVALAVIFWLVGVAGAATVAVSRTSPFASDAVVPAKVKAECGFETRLPRAVADSAPEVQLVDGAVSRRKGRSLELVIHDIHAPGGGAFSGPKWATVRGTLHSGGKVVGSFRAKRYSTGGAFGAVMGTCGILNRIANAMGSDIAGFLESPSLNAKLGDAK
jgi:hypothetical protein